MEGQEISLKSYINVIIKWKNLIIAICVIAALSTLVLTSLGPDHYQSKAVIQPAFFNKDNIGKEALEPLSKNILKERITQVEDWEVVNIDIKADNNDLIIITVTARHPLEAKVVCEEMSKEYIAKGNILYNFRKEILSNRVQKLTTTMEDTDKAIQHKKNMINQYKAWKLQVKKDQKENLQQKLANSDMAIENIQQKISSLKTKLDKNDAINAVSQSSDLNMQIAECAERLMELQEEKFQHKTILLELNNLSESALGTKEMISINKYHDQLKILNKYITDLEKQRYGLKQINQKSRKSYFIEEPKKAEGSLQSLRRISVVLLSAVLGLLLGVFLSLFIEYWKKG